MSGKGAPVCAAPRFRQSAPARDRCYGTDCILQHFPAACAKPLKWEFVMRTRAAVALAPGKPLEIMEVNLADPKEGEVLVEIKATGICHTCLLYTSPSPRDTERSRMPSSA